MGNHPSLVGPIQVIAELQSSFFVFIVLLRVKHHYSEFAAEIFAHHRIHTVQQITDHQISIRFMPTLHRRCMRIPEAHRKSHHLVQLTEREGLLYEFPFLGAC